MCTIPAFISARQSHEAAKNGDLKAAWEQGVQAAYLNVAAIAMALIIAGLCIGIILSPINPE